MSYAINIGKCPGCGGNVIKKDKIASCESCMISYKDESKIFKVNYNEFIKNLLNPFDVGNIACSGVFNDYKCMFNDYKCTCSG